MRTVRAKTTRERVVEATVEEVVVLEALQQLEDEAPATVASELWGMGIEGDREVGVLMGDVPGGCWVRKPHGSTPYMKLEDSWLRRELGIGDPRVLVATEDGRVSLLKSGAVVMARLSRLLDRWEEIDSCLGEFRCPK